MPNQNYPQLSPEEKRRKQTIRNWKRMQKELVESYKFATKCAGIRYVPSYTPKTVHSQRVPSLPQNYAYTATCKTLVNLFHSDDEVWNNLDNSKQIAEQSALFCLE